MSLPTPVAAGTAATTPFAGAHQPGIMSNSMIPAQWARNAAGGCAERGEGAAPVHGVRAAGAGGMRIAVFARFVVETVARSDFGRAWTLMTGGGGAPCISTAVTRGESDVRAGKYDEPALTKYLRR